MMNNSQDIRHGPASLHLRLALSLLAGAICWAALPIAAKAAGETAALRGTAVSQFSSVDYALMRSAAARSIDAAQDGQRFEWSNTKTTASGSVTSIGRSTWNGLACRRLHVVNSVRGAEDDGVYLVCRQPNGLWKLVHQISR